MSVSKQPTALLVAVKLPPVDESELDASLSELERLVVTLGYRVVGRVVQAAGRIPILVRGGGKAATKEILQRTWELMQQGACGIVYGRNVIQHKDPGGITRAFMAVVHENVSPEEALSFLQTEPAP